MFEQSTCDLVISPSVTQHTNLKNKQKSRTQPKKKKELTFISLMCAPLRPMTQPTTSGAISMTHLTNPGKRSSTVGTAEAGSALAPCGTEASAAMDKLDCCC